MLVICKLGPTTQTVRGRPYEFKVDSFGRAICDVNPEHVHIFLAREVVYALAAPDAADAPNSDAHRIDRSAAKAVPPRRGGRPRGTGKNDGPALIEMRQLMHGGAGLNRAAASVATRLTGGDPKRQDTMRKRLLRKHQAGLSR